MVWSLHLYGPGSRANKLYSMADEIRSMHSDEPHKNNLDEEKQRKKATGRYDSKRIHTVMLDSETVRSVVTVPSVSLRTGYNAKLACD